jgi:hypothetical protein
MYSEEFSNFTPPPSPRSDITQPLQDVFFSRVYVCVCVDFISFHPFSLRRADPLCRGVRHQCGDQERDGGMVRAGRDQGEGDRTGADPRAQPGPRAHRLRRIQRHSQQATEGRNRGVGGGESERQMAF